MDIIEAVKSNNLAAVTALLKNGADVNTRDSGGRNLLLLATGQNQEEMAGLLVRLGADVNMQDDIKDSPFLLAGARGYTNLVKLYLSHGARFDVFNRYYGSALIPACERGHVETVRLLANTEGYPVNHINNLGWTALLEAIILSDGGKNHQKVVRILKDAGADLNIADKDGMTPLQHAQKRGFREIIKILSE